MFALPLAYSVLFSHLHRRGRSDMRVSNAFTRAQVEIYEALPSCYMNGMERSGLHSCRCCGDLSSERCHQEYSRSVHFQVVFVCVCGDCRWMISYSRVRSRSRRLRSSAARYSQRTQRVRSSVIDETDGIPAGATFRSMEPKRFVCDRKQSFSSRNSGSKTD